MLGGGRGAPPTVDDALHEFTDIRAELVALLSPRLAPQKGRKGEGKGKEQWKGHQLYKGKSKETKGGPGTGKGKPTKGARAFE